MLQLHVKSVHEKRRDFECGQCDYSTADKRHLKRHTDNKHK